LVLQASAGGAGTGAGGLTLLSPWGLSLLGLLVPLVVLYILKIKRAKKRVSSTWLWASAKRDLLAKSPFQKLIPHVSLVLQALAIILAALALAQPATRAEEGAGDHLAVVIDVSASMNAFASGTPGAADGETRLAAAKKVARRIVETLPPGSDAMIVEAGRSARVASGLERDRRRLATVIDHLEGADVEGDLGEAVSLAVDRLLQTTGERRVIVVTDGNLARPATFTSAALPVELLTVGEKIDNTAIVRVDVRSGVDPATRKESVETFALVVNYGEKPREVFVTLRQDQASDVLASRRLLVQPGERAPVVLAFESTPGDWRKGLIVDISPHDAMPVDDVAWGRVPPGDTMPVVLAAADDARPSPWLERVLAADPRAKVERATLTQLAGSTGIDPSALIVVDGVCPPDLPGGDLVIVNPPPGACWGATVGAERKEPLTVTSWDAADPRMRFLQLDGVQVGKARELTPDSASRELVRSAAGPLLVDVSTASRTVTMLGFDVGDSDWPLKASFVLFARNVLDLARTHRERGVAGPQRAGEPLRIDVPGSATQLEAKGPDDRVIEASLQGGLAVVPSADRAGLYRLSWQGKQAGSVVVPVNLASEAESDLRTLVTAPPGGAVTVRVATDKPDAHRGWGWIAAIGMILLVIADVTWATRKPKLPGGAAPAVPRAPDRTRAPKQARVVPS
jgi:hypothetical protein